MSLVEKKAYLRDIKLTLIENSDKFKIDISKRYNKKFRLFYPSRKLIKCIIKNGGVLTGSRSIRCYLYKEKTLLDRKTKDWDFIVTLDMAYKICSEMNLDTIPKIGDTISIKNQRIWRHPDYSDSYRVGKVDVQLIVNEFLPNYNKIGKIRLASLEHSLSKKLDITEKLEKSTSSEDRVEFCKHLSDLNQIILNFNILFNNV